MEHNIRRTLDFLKQQFDQSVYMSSHPMDKKYRLEHTMRVAKIGQLIARGEGFEEETLIIGCLLHDLSYVDTFNSEDDWLNHGRNAAKMARPFLETLDLSQEQIDAICYGIAIHVDDQADFPGERSPLAVSIGDCDNIDRFDVYRIHETLKNRSFTDLPLEEQAEYVRNVLQKLSKYNEIEFATKTRTHLWKDRITFQMEFFTRLQAQLDLGTVPHTI